MFKLGHHRIPMTTIQTTMTRVTVEVQIPSPEETKSRTVGRRVVKRRQMVAKNLPAVEAKRTSEEARLLMMAMEGKRSRIG